MGEQSGCMYQCIDRRKPLFVILSSDLMESAVLLNTMACGFPIKSIGKGRQNQVFAQPLSTNWPDL